MSDYEDQFRKGLYERIAERIAKCDRDKTIPVYLDKNQNLWRLFPGGMLNLTNRKAGFLLWSACENYDLDRVIHDVKIIQDPPVRWSEFVRTTDWGEFLETRDKLGINTAWYRRMIPKWQQGDPLKVELAGDHDGQEEAPF